MEPFINADLNHSVKAPFDLTLQLFIDIGWQTSVLDGNPGGTATCPSSFVHRT